MRRIAHRQTPALISAVSGFDCAMGLSIRSITAIALTFLSASTICRSGKRSEARDVQSADLDRIVVAQVFGRGGSGLQETPHPDDGVFRIIKPIAVDRCHNAGQ